MTATVRCPHCGSKLGRTLPVDPSLVIGDWITCRDCLHTHRVDRSKRERHDASPPLGYLPMPPFDYFAPTLGGRMRVHDDAFFACETGMYTTCHAPYARHHIVPEWFDHDD